MGQTVARMALAEIPQELQANGYIYGSKHL